MTLSPKRTALLLLVGWLLILLKCLLVVWAVRAWQMPFAAGWLIWPTVLFGALVTLLGWPKRRTLA